MLKMDIRVLDTKAQDVTVRAYARGFYGTPDFNVTMVETMNYAPQYTVEELISDISMRAALSWQKQVGGKCWIERIVIEETNYEDYDEEDDIPEECLWDGKEIDEAKLRQVGDEAFWEAACKVLAESYQ